MRMPMGLPPAEGRPFDVVGFGLNMTDLLVVVEGFPRPGSKQPVRRQAYSPGGQAASAMVACARLGWRARYVGCFGDDENGRQGRSSLADEGVDISACRVAADTRNGMSVILVDDRTGERTVLWSRDPGLKLRPDDVDPAAVGVGRVLLVDCHDTAASTAAARHARRAETRTVIDVERVRDGIEALLAEIDMIITAQNFPAALTGKSAPGAALRAIRDAYHPALVCMTLGAEGSLALVGDVEVRTPGFRVPVVDSTGAGDVFRGGFISGWLRGGDDAELEDVLRYANAVAALKCRGLGAREASPTPAEVDALLAGGPG
jgi:sugar/nucleoside kinase (ribokinase family)